MKKHKTKRIHDDLEGLDVHIDEMGKVASNIPIEKINQFLDKTVEDKKLINAKDTKEDKPET